MSGYRGGAGGLSTFSDSFSGPIGPLGQSWAQGGQYNTPFTNPTCFLNFGILAAPDANPALATIGAATGVPSSLMWGYAVPIVLTSQVWGKTQFCQATLAGDNLLGSTETGLGVLIKPNAMPVGYALLANRAVPSVFLQRSQLNGTGAPGSNLNQAALATNINANSWPVGTVTRISVDMTNPAAPVIVVKFNGVVVAQVTDNVSPLSGGLPGFQGVQANSGGSMFYRNFSGGLGL